MWYSLSETSTDEYVPPPSKANPAYWAYDLLYASIAFGVVNYLAGGPSLSAFTSRPGEAIKSCGAAIAAAAAVFTAFRSLPEVSHRKLLEAEATLLKTVQGDVRHHWCRYSTKHEPSWHIHSLLLRSKEHAAEDADGSSRSTPSSSRPQLLIVHGHSAGSSHWEAILDRISAVADIWVIDLPGWGRSPCPQQLERSSSPTRTIELVTECIKGYLDVNGLKKVILLGHSLGGFYAVQFAHRYPDAVQQLLLVAPAGMTPVMPDQATLYGFYYRFMPPQRIARNCGRLGYLIFRTLYLALTVEDKRFPDVYYQLAAATAYTGYGDRYNSNYLRISWQGGKLGLFWSHPCLSLLMSLDMPVSVIWGQRDELLPPILGSMLHRIRPHTDLYYIAGALHNPAHNNAAAFCDTVADAILKYSGKPRVTLQPMTSQGAEACSERSGTDISAALSSVAASAAGRDSGNSESFVADPFAFSDGTANRLLSTSAVPNTFAVPPPSAEVVGSSKVEAAVSIGIVHAGPSVRTVNSNSSGAVTPVSGSSTTLSAPTGAEPKLQQPQRVPQHPGHAFQASSPARPHPHSRPMLSHSESLTSLAASTPSRMSEHRWRNDWSRATGRATAASGIAAVTSAPEPASPLQRLRASFGLRSPLTSPLSSSRAGAPASAAAFSSSSSAAAGGVGASCLPPQVAHHHDGVVAPVGRGRGYCNACFHAVGLHKAYWRCGCGAWSFNAHVLAGQTKAHFELMLSFLDELYVYGTFNFQTSQTIIRVIRTRTPLPRPHPPAATAAMQQLLASEALAASAGGGGGGGGGSGASTSGGLPSSPSFSHFGGAGDVTAATAAAATMVVGKTVVGLNRKKGAGDGIIGAEEAGSTGSGSTANSDVILQAPPETGLRQRRRMATTAPLLQAGGCTSATRPIAAGTGSAGDRRSSGGSDLTDVTDDQAEGPGTSTKGLGLDVAAQQRQRQPDDTGSEQGGSSSSSVVSSLDSAGGLAPNTSSGGFAGEPASASGGGAPVAAALLQAAEELRPPFMPAPGTIERGEAFLIC